MTHILSITLSITVGARKLQRHQQYLQARLREREKNQLFTRNIYFIRKLKQLTQTPNSKRIQVAFAQKICSYNYTRKINSNRFIYNTSNILAFF